MMKRPYEKEFNLKPVVYWLQLHQGCFKKKTHLVSCFYHTLTLWIVC